MKSFFTTHVPLSIYYLCALMCGITLYCYDLLFILPVCIASSALLFKLKKNRYAFFFIIICIGVHWHLLYRHLYDSAVNALPNTPATITATVFDIQKTTHRIFKHRVILALEKIDDTYTPRYNPHHKLHVYVASYPRIDIDDTITFDVALKKPPQSSYRRYLMREQVIATVFISKLSPTEIKTPPFSFPRWVYSTKNTTLKNATRAMTYATKSLYASLFLGNKTYTMHCYESIKEQFRRWGLSHYLARSGLHLVLIVALWLWLFRIIPLSFLYKEWAVVILVGVYAVMSWPSISFVRALTTFFLFKVCSSWWRRYHNTLHLLSVTAFYLLLQNPLHLFYLDFQLSFGVTFALAWLHLLKTYQIKTTHQTIASL